MESNCYNLIYKILCQEDVVGLLVQEIRDARVRTETIV